MAGIAAKRNFIPAMLSECNVPLLEILLLVGQAQVGKHQRGTRAKACQSI